jgi:N-carbamoyl-L-amino-acid hydrolase
MEQRQANPDRVAQAVSEQRQWDLLMHLATFGATSAGGVNRQALSAEDTAAKNFIADWARARSFSVFQDEAANLFVRRPGMHDDIDPVVIGSHIDSQPTGGRFDGVYGVVAGLEVLEALSAAGVVTTRPVEVVAWMNEEGSRFLPGAAGSSVFAGSRTLDDVAAVVVDDSTVGAEIAASRSATRATHRAFGAMRPFAYLEPHIEQGPILELEGLPIGVVTGIQAVRRLLVEVRGTTAHAGTAPLRTRRDAFVAAVRIAAALHETSHDDSDVLRFTIGKFELLPGSPNTVPDLARFTIDLRHPDLDALDDVTSRIVASVRSEAAPCDAEARVLSTVAPTVFPAEIQQLLGRSADALGLSYRRIVSGAGHDAAHLARICPTGMVFVPCRDGLSHHESEYSSPAELAAGTRVTAHAVTVLAGD